MEVTGLRAPSFFSGGGYHRRARELAPRIRRSRTVRAASPPRGLAVLSRVAVRPAWAQNGMPIPFCEPALRRAAGLPYGNMTEEYTLDSSNDER